MDHPNHASIESSCFISNKVGSCVGPFEGPGGQFSYVGGAISALLSSVNIMESKFFGNSAEVGGVLCALHSNITTVNSTFAENHMHAPHGPFLIDDQHAHWTLCFNLSSYSNSSTHSITELQEAQIPTNSLKSFFYGGVIALFHSNATITGSKFRNNTSETGGALAISKSVTMILNCDFEENTATQFQIGGALKIGAVCSEIKLDTQRRPFLKKSGKRSWWSHVCITESNHLQWNLQLNG